MTLFPNSPRPRLDRVPWFALSAGLLIAHGLFYVLTLGGDAVDDAYISFRYARNAILGHGLVFNPGERVEGFTNFLWTTLMIPLEGSGVDVGRASIVLGVLFAAGILWLVLRFDRGGGGRLAALLLSVDGTFALWAVGGLETALFGFLILAGAVLYVREQRAGAWPYSGIFFALAAMTRPEGALVFGLTVAHQAAWRILAERRLLTRRDVERVLGFLVIFAPYWLGRWAYYRSFLPNSFYAKVSPGGPGAQLARGWAHLSQFIGVHLGWIILLPPLVALGAALYRGLLRPPEAQRETTATRFFWATYFALVLVGYAAYIVYVGGDWSVGRFFLPLLAPFYLLLAAGLGDAWGWVRRRWPLSGAASARVTVAAGTALAALLFVFSSWNGEYGIFIRGFNAATATVARETMGRWLRTNAPRGTWIAVDAAGQVPYFSDLPAIDMFGINDLHIGRLPVATLGQGTPGHEKFDLGYVISRAPTYVIIYGTLLDGVKEYARAPVTWTSDPELTRFLTLYVRRP